MRLFNALATAQALRQRRVTYPSDQILPDTHAFCAPQQRPHSTSYLLVRDMAALDAGTEVILKPCT